MNDLASGFMAARISGYTAKDYCEAVAWNACEKYGRENLYEDVCQELILFALENPSLWDEELIKDYHTTRATWDAGWKPQDDTRNYKAGKILKDRAGTIVRKMIASGAVQEPAKQWGTNDVLKELKSWKKTGELHPEIECALNSHRLPTDYQELLEGYRGGSLTGLSASKRKQLQRARDRLTEIINNPLSFDQDEDPQAISNRYVVGGPGTRPRKPAGYEGTPDEFSSAYDDPSGVYGRSEDAYQALEELPVLRSSDDFSAATEAEVAGDLLGVPAEDITSEVIESLRKRFDVDFDCWWFANSGKHPSASFAFAYGALTADQQKALLVRYGQGYTSKQKRARFLAGVDAVKTLRKSLAA